MKKSMIAIGVATLCGAVSFADVQSANTVGYVGNGLTDGKFNMISASFNKVDGTGLQPNDGDLKFENLIEGIGFDNVDLIEIWNPNRGYTYHYFFEGDGWTDDSGNGYFEDDYPDGLSAGDPMWLEATTGDRAGDLKVTVAGGVEDKDDVTYELVAGKFNMISNPYPVNWSPNDSEKVAFENVIEGMGFDGVDLIEVWDPSRGYTYHYFFEGDGWTDDSGNGYFEDDYPKGLAAGQPVWYEAAPNANVPTVTFLNPLKK